MFGVCLVTMKVIHMIATNFVGGPEKQILSHIEYLVENDCQVVIVTFDEPGGLELSECSKMLGIDVLLLPSEVSQVFSAYKALSGFIKDYEPDVLCAHGFKGGVLAFLLKVRCGQKYIVVSRGWTSENVKVKAYNIIDKFLLRFADVVVAVSESQKKKILKCFVSEQNVHVINNFVTIADEAADQHNRRSELVREKFALTDQHIALLYAGRLSPEKAPDILVKAFSRSNFQGKQVRLFLAGDGPMNSNVERLIIEHNLEEKVVCLGFRKDIYDLLAAFDVLVLPSLSEGLPNIVLEAAVFEMPVIATAVGGVPDIVIDGETGLLVQPSDIDELARSMTFAVDNISDMRSMAVKANEYIFSNFDRKRQSDKYVDLYRKLACDG